MKAINVSWLRVFVLGGCFALPTFSVVAADDAKAGKPAYPLTTCVVSGEKLGSMGKSYVHEHKGKEVQFCCKSCLKSFDKDPAKYLAKIEKAAKK
jgi:YHS domain-containing protein